MKLTIGSLSSHRNTEFPSTKILSKYFPIIKHINTSNSAMSFALCHYLPFLSLLPLLIAAQNNRINLGSSLTAGNESSWVSPSGDFTFGFQPVGTQGYILAIWFNKIAERTVTWSANGAALAQKGSTLQLTSDGSLILHSTNGTIMWSASVSGAAYAAMLDSGNFVLRTANPDPIWQSFNVPTDTILPTQIMSEGSSLISRFSDTNYSSGRFQLKMQEDGNAVLYPLNWPQQSTDYDPYYMTNTIGSGHQLVFNESGSVYVAALNGTDVFKVFSDQRSANDSYERVILESDGVLRKYVYPRSNSTGSPMKWAVQGFAPQDICNAMQGKIGGGACGFNSFCTLGNDQRPNCACPPYYLFLDPMDQIGGCKPNFTLQSCEEDSQESGDYHLEPLVTTGYWGSDYQQLDDASDASCQDACSSDCLCAAAVFDSGQQKCFKKRFPLSNGHYASSVSSTTYLKVRIGNSTSSVDLVPGGGGSHKENDHQTLILVGSFSLGGSVLLNILFIILAVFTARFCTYKRKERERTQEHKDIEGTSMRSFSYAELEEATNGFKEAVGQGAFATVYKGFLDSEEGNVIAVKKLNELVKENQREFESEVRAIARTGHRNLVQLLGFCNDGQHRLLVYNYMPNGSLADILFKEQKPNWLRRIRFAFETARGLNYLHEECSIQIIHCDIKPQNVLLDDSFTARISDFGLAKLLRKDQTHTMTGIRGTKGYVAPEWFRSMPITAKVDVYSYGILLLEIICCRRCFVADMEDESQMVLADWAYDCYKEGRIDKLVKGDNEALNDIEKVKKLVMVALWCIQEDPYHRPSMNKVVELIKEALEESPPQDLASHIISMNDYRGNSLPFTDGDFSNI